eukprot:m.53234 g.53234  ORF g.53234 m.53234 type:complete len:728 (+) comp13542_c0_seq1:63-2246(+)
MASRTQQAATEPSLSGLTTAIPDEFASRHAIHPSELQAYVDEINRKLHGNDHCQHLLPLEPATALFDKQQDGLLFCELLNTIEPGVVPVKQIHRGTAITPHCKVENQNLVIANAKALGCKIFNIGVVDLMKCVDNNTQHLVMGMTWQVIKASLTQGLSITHHPELIRLLKSGEALDVMLGLPAEEILLRWMNYHLDKANYGSTVTNFSSSIRNSMAYAHLLKQLAPTAIELDLGAIAEESDLTRATRVLEAARAIGCHKFVQPTDIVEGHERLNLAFVANLFNNYPGISLPTESELAALNKSKTELYDQLKQAQDQAASFKRSTESLHRELVEAQAALAEETSARQAQNEQHASEKQALVTDVDGIRAQLAQLQAQLIASSEEHDAAKQALEAQLKEIKESLDAEATTSQQLESELKQANAQLRDANEEVLSYKAASTQGQEAYERARNDHQSAADMVKQLTESTVTLEGELNRERRTAHEAAATAQIMLSQKETELQKANDQNAAQSLDIKRLQDELDAQYDLVRAKDAMLDHLSAQVMRKESQVEHLKVLYSSFVSPKKLFLSLFPDHSRSTFEKAGQSIENMQSQVLFRTLDAILPRSKPKTYWVLLKDNFLAFYKPAESATSPVDVFRLDDAVFQRDEVDDGVMMVISCVQNEGRPVVNIRFEDDRSADLWHNAIMISSQWWSDNRQKRATMLLMSPAGSRASLFHVPHEHTSPKLLKRAQDA